MCNWLFLLIKGGSKMRKYIISILTVLLLLTSIVSVTYAWFTYVERKSLASIEAGVLSVSVEHNQDSIYGTIDIEDLAFMDYENEFLTNDDDMTNIMASAQRFDILLDDESPQAKISIAIDEASLANGFIYLFIYEGMDIASSSITTDYYALLQTIIAGSTTKAEQLQAISDYNMAAQDMIRTLNIDGNSSITFQIVAWGDYDAIDTQETYLDEVFSIQLDIDIINSKGDFS
jgi:hypothetical protein